MRIGFDVAQTCVDKAGCAWYADSLIRAMVKLAPANDYALYHHFGDWINASTTAGTGLDGANIKEPFRGMTPEQAQAAWSSVKMGDPLPGQPEIVHANCYQAPRLTGAKLVFTVYDLSFWAVPEYTTEANRLICQTGMLQALGHADGFVFISQNSRDEFERMVPGWLEETRKPWVVTLLGSKNQLPKIPRPKICDYWLAIGSLEPRKNYETLLDAIELYWRQSLRKMPLKIAGGSGWKSEQLKQRIETLAQRGMVTHLGYVPEEQLPDLYRKAEALIFPSWYEGFGLPVLEAMSQGCPVISSDHTSLREVGGDAAVYVDAVQPTSIAQAMFALETNANLQSQHGQSGLRQSDKFSWERTAKKTLEFYQRVLSH